MQLYSVYLTIDDYDGVETREYVVAKNRREAIDKVLAAKKVGLEDIHAITTQENNGEIIA